MVGQRDVFEAADHSDAGDVDPHVDAAESRERRAGEPFDVAHAADVRGDGERLTASSLALVRELLEELGASRGQYQASALIGELEGHTLAEAARCAGDDDDPPVVRCRSHGGERPAADHWSAPHSNSAGNRIVS
jgi:hypothetical protein